MRNYREILLAVAAFAILIVPNVWFTIEQSRDNAKPATTTKKQLAAKNDKVNKQSVEKIERHKDETPPEKVGPPSIQIVEMKPDRPVVNQLSTFQLASDDDKATIQVAVIKGNVKSELLTVSGQSVDAEQIGGMPHWHDVPNGLLRLTPQKAEVLQLQFRSVDSEGTASKPLAVAWQVKTTSQAQEMDSGEIAAGEPIDRRGTVNLGSTQRRSTQRKWGTKRDLGLGFRSKEHKPIQKVASPSKETQTPPKDADVQLLTTIDAHDGPVTSFSKNFDDVFLSSGNDNQIKLWSLTGSTSLEAKDTIPFTASALCFSPSHQSFLAGGNGEKSKAAVFNPATLDEVTNRVQVRSVYAADFSPSGNYFAVGGEGRVIDICDSSSGERRFVLTGVRKTVRHVLFLLDNPYLLVVSLGADEDQGEVLVWRFMSDGTSLEGTAPELNHSQLSDRIGRLRRSSSSSTRNSRTTGNNQRRKKSEPEIKPTIRYQADSGKLMLCADSFLNVVDRRPNLTVALGCDDKSIYLWEINAAEQPTDRIDGHETKVTALISLANGDYMFAADAGGNVKLWNTSQKQVESEFDSGEGAVHAMAFRPALDSSARLTSSRSYRNRLLSHSTTSKPQLHGTLYTGHNDGEIRVWTVRAKN